LVLKYVTGQPQKKIGLATDVFSACTVPPISGPRHQLGRTFGGVPQGSEEFVLRPSERDPNGPHSNNGYLQKSKFIPFR
jgi:hypothetical protein